MSVTGRADGGPAKAGVPVGDFAAGLYAAYTIAALLPQVGRTGTSVRRRLPDARLPARHLGPADQ